MKVETGFRCGQRPAPGEPVSRSQYALTISRFPARREEIIVACPQGPTRNRHDFADAEI
jgi:hypothetical protein